jgi:hypothetical protein
MCTSFLGEEGVSTNEGSTILRANRQAQEIQGGQVLFIGIADQEFPGATQANLIPTPALTVGESKHSVQGGMIGFFLEDDKIRFEINLTAAEHAQLKISARLASLAKTVIGSPKGTCNAAH